MLASVPPATAFNPITSARPLAFARRTFSAMKASTSPKREWYWAHTASRYLKLYPST